MADQRETIPCPDCGRNTPASRGRCLYCGAALPAGSDALPGTGAEAMGATALGREAEEAGAASGPPGGEEGYFRLNDLPEDLRRRVEEALRGGRPDKPAIPAAEEIDWRLELLRSKRRAPMSKLTLTLIFFCSMILVGFIVWLLS